MVATILLVDNSDLGEELLEVLEMEDLNGILAFSAVEALAGIQQHVPDVIVTDLMMADMDGFELMRRLHDLPALDQTPILVMSAASDYQAKAMAAGAADFLAKPFLMSEFLASIRQVLRNIDT